MRKMQISFRVPVSVWTGPGSHFLSGSSCLQRAALFWPQHPSGWPEGAGRRLPPSVPYSCSVSCPGDTGGNCDLSLRVGALLPRSQPSPGCTAGPSPPLTPVNSLPQAQTVPLTHSPDLSSPEMGPGAGLGWDRTAPLSSCQEDSPPTCFPRFHLLSLARGVLWHLIFPVSRGFS